MSTRTHVENSTRLLTTLLTAVVLLLFATGATFVDLQPVDPASPNKDDPEFLALKYLYRSAEFVPGLQEFLVNEKELLRREQDWLAAELMKPEYMRPPQDQWSAKTWLFWAKINARAGNQEECAKYYLKALSAARKLVDEDQLIYKQRLLTTLAVRLARSGDFANAEAAAIAIDVADRDSLTITEQGSFNVPPDAGRSYALLLVAALQAEAKDGAGALKVAAKIPDTKVQAAAYWVIALRQAEQGDLAEATATSKRAAEAAPQPNASTDIFEFTLGGPSPVPLDVYRSLALGRMAQQQCLAGDSESAMDTIQQLANPLFRDAMFAELALRLAAANHTSSARKWLQLISDQRLKSAALYELALQQMQSPDGAAIEQTAAAIALPQWEAKSRLAFATHLLTAGDPAAAQKQLAAARTSIDNIQPPARRGEPLFELGKVQLRAGQTAEARTTLLESANIAQSSLDDPTVRCRVLAQIAAALARTGDTENAHALITSALQGSKFRDDFDRSQALLAVVEEFAPVRPDGSLENAAWSIPYTADRVQALSAVAESYAQHWQWDTSRMLFAAAMGEALKVDDLLGLNTPYCKGGAIRLVARTQGECDREGLLEYLEDVENANVKAYGYLGLAESYVPDAVERASTHDAEFPRGLLRELWAEGVISRLLASSN